jgi:protein-tyrosine phosphatase
MTRKLAAASLSLALVLSATTALAAVSAEKVERTAPDKVLVTWTDKAPVDVYVAEGPADGIDKAKLVSAKDRDGRYEAAAGADRPFFLLKDQKDGSVVRTAERLVPLEQGSNFRDLGGYPAAEGKHVRWGMIFRSGGTPMLTDADLKEIRSLGLTDMVDLRSSEERVLAPSRIYGVSYHAVGYSMTDIMGDAKDVATNRSSLGKVYERLPTVLQPQLRELFEALLQGDGPLVYNCSAGQDRTGFASALVLTALGVPRDVIYADYLLSTTYRRPEWEMPKVSPAVVQENPTAAFFARYQDNPAARKPTPLVDAEGRPLLQHALEAVEQKYGSVEAYLDKEIGVDAADIAKLRALYTE